MRSRNKPCRDRKRDHGQAGNPDLRSPATRARCRLLVRTRACRHHPPQHCALSVDATTLLRTRRLFQSACHDSRLPGGRASLASHRRWPCCGAHFSKWPIFTVLGTGQSTAALPRYFRPRSSRQAIRRSRARFDILASRSTTRSRLQIAGSAIDQCRFGSAQGVCAELERVEADARDPLTNQASILTCCEAMAAATTTCE
jgi:hypothetical protein